MKGPFRVNRPLAVLSAAALLVVGVVAIRATRADDVGTFSSPSTTSSTSTTSSPSTATAAPTTSSSTSTSTIEPATTTTTLLQPTAAGCIVERNGSTVTLEWLDEGGVHVLRRNGSWLSTPGSEVSSWVDPSSPAGAIYDLHTWVGDQSQVRDCVEEARPPAPPALPPPTAPPSPAERTADRVIHVSIDGLRSDHVTPELMPALTGLMAEGASTLNARTDPAYTQTLPNHHSQFTGRSVFGASGHQVDYNTDQGTTVHAEADTYVSSVFDVVHDHGGSTLLYAGKSKFDMMDRNWNATNGAPDLVGTDDGRDKIDSYLQIDPALAVDPLLEELNGDPQLEYAFFHIRYPDASGHDSTWASPEYGQAVTRADGILGEIVAAIEADPNWAVSTAIIVVSDHGGPTDGLFHDDGTIEESYTIPFVVWGPGVQAGADLYDLNPTNRTDPGVLQVPLGAPQPIRGHEVANLALEFLGYESVPGSTYNSQQDLAYG